MGGVRKERRNSGRDKGERKVRRESGWERVWEKGGMERKACSKGSLLYKTSSSFQSVH